MKPLDQLLRYYCGALALAVAAGCVCSVFLYTHIYNAETISIGYEFGAITEGSTRRALQQYVDETLQGTTVVGHLMPRVGLPSHYYSY